MKRLILAVASAAALMLGGCGDGAGDKGASANNSAPLPQIKAPNGDWTQVVSQTSEGGMRMGNPAAPVKLVEYGSLGCGHCADFAEAATQPLEERYVKSGQVSWEFRPYLLFATDPGLSALAICQGPAPFFQLVEQLYAQQRDLQGKVEALPPAAQQQLQAMPAQQQAIVIIKAAGLDQFFRQRGMPQSRIDACLADPQAIQRLIAIRDRATREEGVTSTPTFFINGSKFELEPGEPWPQVEAALREAMS